MQNILTLGRRLIPTEQIVWVEAFDPESQPDFKSDKPFRSRVVLLNRDTHLSEDAPETLATRLAFRFLAEDQTAFNPNIVYQVETFAPTDSFKPEKPFKTRLKWRDANGEEQSKLLLTPAEVVIATVVRQGPNLSRKTRSVRPMSRRRVEKMQNARS